MRAESSPVTGHPRITLKNKVKVLVYNFVCQSEMNNEQDHVIKQQPQKFFLSIHQIQDYCLDQSILRLLMQKRAH